MNDETADAAPAADPAQDALRAAVREIEAHVATDGWDQPGRLYALVPTQDLVRQEPGLAETLGIAGEPDAAALTPVEQDHTPVDRSIEEVLEAITWPPEVFGTAVVVERLVLPPSADEELPETAAEAQEFAAQHPDRQEVRMAAAVTRDGGAWCALRLRSHELDDLAVVEGPDLVPALVELLRTTLDT